MNPSITAWRIGFVCLLTVIALMTALHTGSVAISWSDIFKGEQAVFWHIRLPRVLLGLLVGCALGISGAALQGLFRNMLADPGLIGVSSGAAMAAVAMIVLGNSLGLPVVYLLPLVAFGGGLLVSILVYKLAGGGGSHIANILLAGIALNAIAGAGIGLLTYISDDQQLRDLTFWLMGGLGGALWHPLVVSFLLIAPAVVVLLTQRNALNALALGERQAFYIGIDTAKTKRLIILAVAMAVGAAVALSGIIGFIGLVVPHIIRLTVGANHRLLLPLSGLIGAALLITADSVARIIIAPAELPVGLITAIVGGPFFLWLLVRGKDKMYFS